MKCQPLNFKGTEGVVELTQWVEKMEINSHVRTVGNDITYAMTWAELKKKMTDKYCPRTEIKKLEVELWELKVKGVLQIFNASNNQRGTEVGQKPTCYECGNQGHYKSDCPELKNRNHENQAKGTEARRMVYTFGGGETEQDLNNIEDEIEA
ncbi:putative reverse transcriptase domain-containing protein [Tanacetum coccineum]